LRVVRVVSLVPSVTETLLAWGADVVACTRFCEQPSLRHVGGTKDPDVDAIVALGPDLVVVDREENRRQDAQALAERGLAIHVTHVLDLGDVGPTLAALAERLGVEPGPPAELVVPAAVSERRRAFVAIWRRPWMALGPGTYGASLLEALGVDVVAVDDSEPGRPASRYPMVELADIAALSPDLVLAPSEPYSFRPGHLAELKVALAGHPVVPVDGKDLFWWGVRTPGAMTRLGAQLSTIAT
jgi:ABC-type Fe3+-hydroxamate transport system substrate-binding protein